MNRPLIMMLSGALLAGASVSCAQAGASPAAELPLGEQARVFPGASDIRVQRAADGRITLSGKLDGVAFAAKLPAVWNKSTLLYAHGYVQPTSSEPDPAQTVESAFLNTPLNQGYAVAASAYRKTGYAVNSGIERTARLKAFMDTLGSVRAYAVGHSMGGNIVVGLVEKFPNAFVGALSLCGVTGGWYEEQRYLTDFRLIYDVLTRNTPYALPGSGNILEPHPGLTVEAVQKSVGNLFASAARNATGPEAQLVGAVAGFAGAHPDPVSFVTALAGSAYGLTDSLATTGGNAYSNVGKRYQSRDPRFAGLEARVNSGVERLQADARAADYLRANYSPMGRFTAKVLSVHNTIDPLVPYEHAAIFRRTVSAAENLDNLVQQTVDPLPWQQASVTNSGHCHFSKREHDIAWETLRLWTEHGVKPQDGKNITAK
ncbi:alpha/beta hydrolase [Deinococcus peraridilitoris]|uniref:Putative peptidase n=1 Tax=Deinococcus peraridilitoris (strain DSM 19664 / LMG 22246 / CIP 109416 / KR-200) TaxID=937777 RepID=L0A7E1_DEIPD|nr:alpha/beta fold hydrolase [Deinococcus peraridilitoris]AFZ69087.1 putative peptidase [Deinococcus peraridilitoris DSM 19664]